MILARKCCILARFGRGNFGRLGNFEFGTVFNINLGAPRARPSSFLRFFLLAKCRRRPHGACTWREERKEERKNLILARKCWIFARFEGGNDGLLVNFEFGTVFNINLGAPRDHKLRRPQGAPLSFLLFFLLAKCRRMILARK